MGNERHKTKTRATKILEINTKTDLLPELSKNVMQSRLRCDGKLLYPGPLARWSGRHGVKTHRNAF